MFDSWNKDEYQDVKLSIKLSVCQGGSSDGGSGGITFQPMNGHHHHHHYPQRCDRWEHITKTQQEFRDKQTSTVQAWYSTIIFPPLSVPHLESSWGTVCCLHPHYESIRMCSASTQAQSALNSLWRPPSTHIHLLFIKAHKCRFRLWGDGCAFTNVVLRRVEPLQRSHSEDADNSE